MMKDHQSSDFDPKWLEKMQPPKSAPEPEQPKSPQPQPTASGDRDGYYETDLEMEALKIKNKEVRDKEEALDRKAEKERLERKDFELKMKEKYTL